MIKIISNYLMLKHQMPSYEIYNSKLDQYTGET
jgi:hypothetical protein